MTGTKFIPLIMLTYAVLPKPVQVRSTGYSNICPVDYLPSGKDWNSCSIKIADTESLTTFLKQKTIWQDGYVQHARISIAIVGNVTDKTAPVPKDWIISYIDPSGPFYYVSWRSDFKVLSFGLLDDKPDQKVDIDIVENGNNNCTIQRSNKEITSQVVEYLTKEIRKANVTDNDQDYANIDLCFLTRFTWFIESPWYILKKYFGVPFQEFGYRCCNYFNGTVCCDDKLKEMEGYRIVPYIISVIIFCYIPLLFVRIGNLFTVFHPRHWYAADQTDPTTKNLKERYVSMFGNVFFSEASNTDKSTQKSELMDRAFRIVFVLFLPTVIYIELCIYASAEWKAHIQDVVEDGMLFGFTSMLGDPLDATFLSSVGGPLGALLIYHVLGVLLLILPKNFEKDVIEHGTCHCITGFICKIAPQGCNLQGYKKFERVLKTGIYLWFNGYFWTNRRENTENDEKLAREKMEIEPKICLNVWCNYNKKFVKQTSASNQHKDRKSCSFLITVGKRVCLLIFLPFPLFPFYFVILNGWCRYIWYGPTSKLEDKKNGHKKDEDKKNKDKKNVDKKDEHKKDEHKKDEHKTDEHKKDEHKKDEHKTDEHKKDENQKNEHKKDEHKKVEHKKDENQKNEDKKDEDKKDEDQKNEDKNDEIQKAEDKKDKDKKDEDKKGLQENTSNLENWRKMFTVVKRPVLLAITFLMLVMFLYISSVIVSYSIYLFVYIIYFMCLALVTSPKQTATYLMFVFWGIVFVIQMFKDTLKFYKDIFDLTLQECATNFKTYTMEDENYVVYVRKDVARFVQKKIRPFYVEVGQIFFKAVIVTLAYSAALIFLTSYSLAISDVLQNMTALVTSALPTIIQSQLKPELPKNCVIKYMIKCYENQEKNSITKKKKNEMLVSYRYLHSEENNYNSIFDYSKCI